MAEQTAPRKLVDKYAAGEIICKEGDEGRDMFIIKSGKVEVLKEMGEDSMVLATLGPKEFVGEMALFGVNKRTATVRAVTDTEVVVVTKMMLETQYKKIPDWLVSMIKTLASRIINTSQGTKAHHQISIQYTLLKSISLICEKNGTPTSKGRVIPLDLIRDELMYTLGLPYDEIDLWLKRFNLVNLIKVNGGKAQLEMPDENRLKLFAEYLYSVSPECKKQMIEIDSDTLKSFDRINKLMQR